MSEPSIVHVVDADGCESWAARDSAYIREGLDSGRLIEKDSKILPKRGDDASAPPDAQDRSRKDAGRARD